MIDTDTAPSLAATAVALPAHRHSQSEVIAALSDYAGDDFQRFAVSSGVSARNLAVPLERYPELSSFTETNEVYAAVALDLGERCIRDALNAAGIRPEEVDIVFSTTVTGLAVPTVEARLAAHVGLRPDVKRVPLFGLGCVAGAAGVARMHDYLRAYPDHVAVLLAIELCSLTVQREDHSVANLVASSLFGDGAAAVVATGARRLTSGPQVIASRSRLYPDSEKVMGWKIGTSGFKIVLSADVPMIAEKYLGADVQQFLAEFDLNSSDITTWVCHPGGPKLIDALEQVLDLPSTALARTRESLRENGNLSSASVLDVLRANLADPPAAGSWGMMIAMGPGFCSELVLLRW